MRMVKPAIRISILKLGELGSRHRTYKQTPGFVPGAFFMCLKWRWFEAENNKVKSASKSADTGCAEASSACVARETFVFIKAGRC